jgi:hypothetical protein
MILERGSGPTIQGKPVDLGKLLDMPHMSHRCPMRRGHGYLLGFKLCKLLG